MQKIAKRRQWLSSSIMRKRRRRRRKVGLVGHGRTLTSSLGEAGASGGFEQSSDMIRFNSLRDPPG